MSLPVKSFVPSIRFPVKMPVKAITAGRLVEEALSIARPALKSKSPDMGFVQRSAAKIALWALNKLLRGAATEDDLVDLVQAAAGAVGFAKRRFAVGSPARTALAQADALLDRAHDELGHAAH